MGFDKVEVDNDSGDGEHITLNEDLTYTSNAGEKITIPAGTRSDGASIPRIFWNILPPFGPYWRAAILHDYLYQQGIFVRSKCDALLREAMLSCGVSRFTAWVIYTGVRVGGWVAYNAYRKKEASK